jgi:hypothetical protein
MSGTKKLGTLKALGQVYAVIDDSQDLRAGGYLASTKHSKLEIVVDTASPSVQSSYLHEILHIIDTELSLGLSEETVRRMEVGIRSIWHDNGWLLPEVPTPKKEARHGA